MIEIDFDILDDDGYPTEEYLDTIKRWSFQDDWHELMSFVELGWSYPDMFMSTETTDMFDDPVISYDLSTGGWSGNEDIIDALMSNQMFWLMCWCISKRGGYYQFQVRKKSDD